jgi:hypothetical protein
MKFQLTLAPGTQPRVITVAGRRYFEVVFDVRDVQEVYPAFTAWTY